MSRIALSISLVTALAFAGTAHAAPTEVVKANKLVRFVRSDLAKTIGRGALRVGMFGGGLGMLIVAKSAAAVGEQGHAGALAAGGMNLMMSAFKGNPTHRLTANMALTVATATGGWIMGDGSGAGMHAVGLITAVAPTLGNLGILRASHD
jgi:hypothetical protein